MPKTFTPGDERQDEKLNPGQQDYDRRFNDIAKAEEKGTFDEIADNYDKTADSSQEDANIQQLRDKENAAQTPWVDNTTEQDKPTKKVRAKGWFKKASPALGLGGIFGIGTLILIGMTSPALLIVQLKETMVGRFNTQLASMETRSNKLLIAKVDGATSGYCSERVTLRCKFTTMSEKQVKRFANAGIEVKGDETITGRIKPTSLVFEGNEIQARDFSNRAKTDPAFRDALKIAYNAKYAGFVGKAWAAVAAKFKTSKQAVEFNADESKEEAMKKLNVIAEEGVEDSGSRARLTASGEDCESNCISDEDASKVNDSATAAEAAGADKTATKTVRSMLSGVGTGAAANFFKITGPMDSGCQVYGALTVLSYATKAILAAQLVRYAMVYMNVADQIKAGKSPEPADVEFLGGILTATVSSAADAGRVAIASGTDSFGYKYAAYGDHTASKQSLQIASRFTAGSGFVGEMSTAANTALGFIPGGRQNAKSACATLANPFVQGASIILGVAMLFVPGANVGKIAVSGAISATVGIVLAVLPLMLADIMAGTVTNDIVGEESVNAIASGSGALMSDSLAAQNGNGPMTKDDALAYNTLQTETSNDYIAYELRNTSQLDPTNPHTFVGSMVSSLLPLQSSTNPLTTVGSFFNTSLGNLLPKTNAQSNEDYAKTLDVCQDLDVVDAGYAADPFCNVIRGIPPKYLNMDPIVVIDNLMAEGSLSEDGEPQGTYKTFIEKCITNEAPLGYSSMDTGYDPAEAKNCVINDDNAKYYVNYVDRRVDLGMSDEDTEDAAAATTSTAGVAIDMANLYQDSTGVACAPNTIDKGTSTGYNNGTPFPIRICALPNSDEPSKDGGMAIVNSRVSGAAYAMLEKMKTDIGVAKIPFGDSFRSPEKQQEAINSCGLYSNGGCAAAQGYSNHQSGVALDFEYTNAYCSHSRGITSCPASPYWTWLSQHAGEFGYKNGVDEWWHWSPTGG